MSMQNLPEVVPFLQFLLVRWNQFVVPFTLAALPFIVMQYSIFVQYADFWTFVQAFGLSGAEANSYTYDFIVVGGGSAGAAVAGRLSELYKVILIEAGNDPHPLTYVPLIVAGLMNIPTIDWAYKTEPLATSGFSLVDNRSLWPRGKSLGGSSNTNFMIYMRGNPHDFNRWANHTGDDKWKYENVENVFRKYEDYHGHFTDSGYHGVGGPMHIEKVGFSNAAQYWFKAGQEVGMNVSDPNEFQSEGFSPLDVTQKHGSRFSTFRGYLFPNLMNPNLTIHRYSHATKIHFDKNLQAVGVTYYRHGFKTYASTRNEIIISAGAVNSPKLLMLSGIGPKTHLESIGITTLINSSVGENLQDHVTTYLGPFLFSKHKHISLLTTRDISPIKFIEYFQSGTGPFSSPNGIDAVGLFATSKGSKAWPDSLLTLGSIGIHESYPEDVSKALGLKQGVLRDYLKSDINLDATTVGISVGLPKSRGVIKLRDRNAFSDPVIDPRYFSDEKGEDMDVILETIEFLVNLFENTTTYQSLGARLPKHSFPGCENHLFKSKSYWECFVRSLTATLYHPCGTCAMGRRSDPAAVVDSTLRVIGTKGLRVADASIMPFITNANLNAPTIMIGEMCADMIIQDWKWQKPNNS